MAHRDEELAELLRLLDLGVSVQMLAPRRVGKTWLMREVEKALKAKGWLTIFCDVEGMRTQDEFLRDLCKKIEEQSSVAEAINTQFKFRIRQLLGNDIDGHPLHAIGKVDAKPFSEALVASLHDKHEKAVILIDEIALFVSSLISDDPVATTDFLYHLRKLRQNYPNVRWLLTGSIGLDAVARRHSLGGALVDLGTFSLEPFSKVEARSYLDQLCVRKQVRWPFQLDQAGFDHLAEQLGWLAPFYLTLIANAIKTDGIAPATIAEIDAAFDQLLAPMLRMSFSPWEEHLSKNFPSTEADFLRAILQICAVQPVGELATTIQASLPGAFAGKTKRDLMDALTALVNDGFLAEHEGRWYFRSGLLRRYWIKYICS